jgi:hypothetical protein
MNEIKSNPAAATEPMNSAATAEGAQQIRRLAPTEMNPASIPFNNAASVPMPICRAERAATRLRGQLKERDLAPDQAAAPSPYTTPVVSYGQEYDEPKVHSVIAPWHWPAPMHPAAFQGLSGQLVEVVGPHSEADPAALLLIFLAAFGNIAGTSAHFLAATRPHPMRLWPNLVGETAKGRKGSAWSSVRYVVNAVAPDWTQRCVQSGMSSGEGLIWAVRDPVIGLKRANDGNAQEVTTDRGVTDKRLFVVEEEFSITLKRAAREGNTISDVLRRAWDDGNLATLTKKSPAHATGAHITVSGHIPSSILRLLMTETEALNGFGNRFLWACVRRSKLLPEGGALHQVDLSPLSLRIRHALRFASTATLIERTPEGRQFWCDLYPVVTSDRPGLLGAITNRAEAHLMRLALTYAMLDNSPQIDVVHLKAALAVWDYCERSAAFIFGAGLGDRIADRLLEELRLAGSRGLTLTAIRDLFQRNVSGDRLTVALARLERLKVATKTTADTEAKGRKAIVWRYSYDQNDPRPYAGPIESYLSFLS